MVVHQDERFCFLYHTAHYRCNTNLLVEVLRRLLELSSHSSKCSKEHTQTQAMKCIKQTTSSIRGWWSNAGTGRADEELLAKAH